MSFQPEMTFEDAKRLLMISHEARWSFPSSQGGDMAPQNSEMSRWIDRTVSVRESFGEAVDLLVRNGYEEEAVEIAANMWRLWIVARDDERGSKFLSAALEATKKKASRSRALALYGNGLFAYRQGKLEDSLQKNLEALEVAEKIKDPEALALANLGLGRVVYEQGDYKRAFSLSAKALELTRTLDRSMRQAPLFMNALSARMLAITTRQRICSERALS